MQQHRWIATDWQKNPLAVYENAIDSRPEPLNLQRFARTNTLPAAIELAKQHMGLVLLPDVASLPLILDNTLVRILKQYRGRKGPFYFVHAFRLKNLCM